MEGLLILILTSGFFASLAFVIILGYQPKPRIISDGELFETYELPYSRRNYFFSAAERSFYEILRRMTPEHTVFAKVRLAELVTIKPTNSRQSHLNRIDRKHIDFVVCDKDLAPVVAIELNDGSHQSPDRQVEQVLAAASLPVVHIPARRGYVMDEVHQLLSPYLRIGSLTL